MSWNHRILAHKTYDSEDVYFQIHEVYYNKQGIPNSYTVSPVSVGGDDLYEITWTLNKMLESKEKPILWAGDNFPEEYRIQTPENIKESMWNIGKKEINKKTNL